MKTIINRGYKYKIEPTQEQKQFFLKSFGCARKLYNFYVDSLYSQLEQQGYKNGFIKDVKFDKVTIVKYRFEYMKEIDSLALCNVQIDFRNSISKFNKQDDKKSYTKKAMKRKENLGITPTYKDLKGMPKLKSIKNNDFKYKTNNQSRGEKWDDIVLKDDLLYIPKLKTPIKVVKHRDLPPESIIKNITVSMDYKGVFYVSLCVEYVKDIEKKVSEKVLGLDYSQGNFYHSSEDKTANYPKYYNKMQDKLTLEQQRLARKILKSNNWIKQKRKISKIQTKIANQRKDWLHKESTKLCKEFDAIIFEDIDLRAMGQCLNLGRNLHDNGFGMFRLFIQYKLEERGKQFVKIDKWYPSSKICNNCKYIKKDLELHDREWTCPECNTKHDRDYNASLNIKEVGQTLLAW